MHTADRNGLMQSLLARLVFLLLPTSTFLELLRLLVRLFNSLADLPLLLACLDCNRKVARLALLSRFLNGAFGFLPICCARADFVPGISC
jgi:hypothetical protein